MQAADRLKRIEQSNPDPDSDVWFLLHELNTRAYKEQNLVSLLDALDVARSERDALQIERDTYRRVLLQLVAAYNVSEGRDDALAAALQSARAAVGDKA